MLTGEVIARIVSEEGRKEMSITEAKVLCKQIYGRCPRTGGERKIFSGVVRQTWRYNNGREETGRYPYDIFLYKEGRYYRLRYYVSVNPVREEK